MCELEEERRSAERPTWVDSDRSPDYRRMTGLGGWRPVRLWSRFDVEQTFASDFCIGACFQFQKSLSASLAGCLTRFRFFTSSRRPL
jgi:hypothetical protein